MIAYTLLSRVRLELRIVTASLTSGEAVIAIWFTCIPFLSINRVVLRGHNSCDRKNTAVVRISRVRVHDGSYDRNTRFIMTRQNMRFEMI